MAAVQLLNEKNVPVHTPTKNINLVKNKLNELLLGSGTSAFWLLASMNVKL